MSIRRRSLLRSAGLTAAASTLPRWLSALDAPAADAGQTIHLNQVGYLPGQKKIASVLLKPGSPGQANPGPTFRVRTAANSAIAFEGKLSASAPDAASGDHLCHADLSALTSPGTYRVELSGALSDLFVVSPDVYRDALRLTMRAFYGQRCGCAVDLGSGYRHAACHASGAFDETSGRSGPVANSGGWHDAGDYGRYAVNSGITCGTLLWAWEMFPHVLQPLHLDIPPTRPALPDYLAEVKWNLEWMLSMQDAGDGGVWHKQTSRSFCAFVMPEKDGLPSQVIGTGTAPWKSTAATADLAAVMAIASRCYAPFDQAFATRCLSAARRAFAWCERFPAVVFKNPPTIHTGDYGDPHCADEILWAAAELYRTTHEPKYKAAVLQAITPGGLQVTAPSWGNVSALGLWSLAFAEPSSEASRSIVKATATAAARLIEQARRNGYGNTLASNEYGWGSNSTAANQSLLLLVAHRLQPDGAAVDAALGNLDYLLGRNCFGVSWVTQLGARPFLHPHHRPSAADGIDAPWPGLLSGGPNAHGGDSVADRLPNAPPMRMWADDERAYSLNEVAINWNAPLVFLLAAARSGIV